VRQAAHGLVSPGASPYLHPVTSLERAASVPLVRISTVSARIEVVAETRTDVAVEGKASVEGDERQRTIRAISGVVHVRVPIGADVVIGTASGRISVTGAVGAVSAVTESGRVEIEAAGSADVRTTSGRVELGRIAGSCCVRTASGRVEVGECGEVDVATQSARIDLRRVHGHVRAHCVSGRIEITMVDPHDVVAETVSGRIEVSLPPGCTPGDTCTVDARSVSGRVDVSER
jgi:DUF4097 and DUF4098 domain-containing protein YvlB